MKKYAEKRYLFLDSHKVNITEIFPKLIKSTENLLEVIYREIDFWISDFLTITLAIHSSFTWWWVYPLKILAHLLTVRNSAALYKELCIYNNFRYISNTRALKKSYLTIFTQNLQVLRAGFDTNSTSDLKIQLKCISSITIKNISLQYWSTQPSIQKLHHL